MKMSIIKIYIACFLLSLLYSPNSTNAKTNSGPTQSDKEFVYSLRKNTSELEVRYKGSIMLTNDDKGIASISPYGYLKIEQASFGNKHSIEIISDANGKLTSKYFEGKKEGSYEKNGKDFLESLFPDLIYKTTIGGKERILRIYHDKGMDAALKEAEAMRTRGKSADGYSSSFVIFGTYSSNFNYPIGNHNLYFKALMDNVKMSEDELSDFIEAIKEINSNSSKGTLLRQILDKYKLTQRQENDFLEATATLGYNVERGSVLRVFQQKYTIDKNNYQDYFRVINSINVNSEKGNVLKPLLKSQKLDNYIFIALIESTRKFTNKSETAAVLREAVKYLPDDQVVVDAFLAAVQSMSSSYRYLKEELNDIVLDRDYLTRNKSISNAIIMSTLNSVRNEDANTKKSTTLRKIHASMSNDPKVIEAYFSVIESMDNKMEAYAVLLELMDQHKFNNVGYIAMFYACEQFAKDDYKHAASAIIRKAISDMPNDKQVHEQLFEAIEEIDHNAGREEIIRLLCSENKATDNLGLLKMLRIAGDIDADIEKAFSMLHIANVISKDQEEINYLYKRLADEMDSLYEYDRAMAVFPEDK